jgi:hypothetical protein
MSIEKLKSVRDEVVATGHGLYLESTKKLLAAIDEHIAELAPVKAKVKKAAEAVENAVGEAAGEAFENRQ